MKANRFILTGAAAAALILAGACRSSSTTKTSTTASTTTVSTTPAVASTTYGTTATSSDPNGTTYTDANGNTVTRTTTTTKVYPNGTATVTDANGNTTNVADTNMASSTQAVPGGATVVVTTTTTTKSTPSTTVVQPAMASSTTQSSYDDTYGRTIFGHRRRYPNFDILAFADRASFSNNNRSLNGTINTGALGSSIRDENGWGVGFNAFFGRMVSAEFTASRIRPTATLTPSNNAFNPITGLRIRMMPITGALQIHFAPHAGIDPYIGGGAEYVTFHSDNGSFNPGTSGLTSIRFRDEWGPMVNAGLRLGNARGISLNIDGKYSWVRARAVTTFDSTTIGNVGNNSRLGLNPLILSAGIRFGF